MKSSIFLQKAFIGVVFCALCLTLPLGAEAKKERKPELQDRRENARENRKFDDDETSRLINWRELDLSREQLGQLKTLRREFQVETASIRQELTEAEEELQTEIRRETIDRDRIEQLVQEVSGLKQRLSEAATGNLLALKEMLTPEQREQLASSQQFLPKELRALQLTNGQKGEIRTLLRQSFRQGWRRSNELRELKSDLRNLLLSPDDPDAVTLEELQAQIAKKELEQEWAKVELRLAIREILSLEQLKMLE